MIERGEIVASFSTTKKVIVVMFAVTLGVVSSACGSTQTSSSDDTSTIDTSVAAHNDADVMFAQMMIPHHEQAIEMSDIALDPTIGASESVRSLATDIKAAQDPEIAQMTAFLESWGQPTAMDSSMDHSSMMSGMLTVQEIENLGTQRGTDFDTAWINAMIKHHEGALQMAKDVERNGVNTDVKKLAAAIITTQQSEIDLMNALLS
jgi:uncharacterized protein (DUF305 family)